MRSLLMRLTGGRPMQRIGRLFVDKVSGEEVNLYRDGLGRHWMATNRWALFRVARSTPAAQEG